MFFLDENELNDKGLLSKSLDEIARIGAKKILAHALELEVEEYISKFTNLKDEKGHRKVVRNGKGKTRGLTLGSGTIEVNAPRIDDRREAFKFSCQKKSCQST